MSIQSQLFACGFCLHREFVTIRGGSFRQKKFPAITALLRHSSGKNILFDTGYAGRFFAETTRFPFSLYARTTPVTIPTKEEFCHQLERAGIRADEIDLVVLSHFHADHTAGLRDFRNARFIASSQAFNDLQHMSNFRAVRKGHIPALLPDDFAKRLLGVEIREIDISDMLPGFENGWDILADKSLIAVPLPGHAQNQFGLYFEDERQGPTFLIADATWSRKAIRENRKPRWPAYAIFDSRKDYDETFDRLVKLYHSKPELRIVPSHCDEVWSEIRCQA